MRDHISNILLSENQTVLRCQCRKQLRLAILCWLLIVSSHSKGQCSTNLWTILGKKSPEILWNKGCTCTSHMPLSLFRQLVVVFEWNGGMAKSFLDQSWVLIYILGRLKGVDVHCRGVRDRVFICLLRTLHNFHSNAYLKRGKVP